MKASTLREDSACAPAVSLAKTQRTGMLILLTTIAAFNTIDRQVISMLGGAIKAEFHLSDGQVGILGLIYGVIFALGAAPLAVIADRTSRRAVITGCTLVFSAATAFCGLAGSYFALILSRFGVAAGEAGTTAPSLSLISDAYPRSERTMALSVFSVASKLGGFIAFLGGGWLAQWFGWRPTFVILGLPGCLLAVMAWRLLKISDRGGTSGAPAAKTDRDSVSIWQVIRHLLSIPTFLNALAAQGLWSLFSLGFAFWIPQYLHRTYDLNTGVIGTAMAVYTLGIGAVGIIALGWLAQRLQRRDIRWMLGVIVAAGLLATPFMWLLLTTSDLWVLLFCAVPPMFVFSSHLGPIASATQSVVPARMRTSSAGVLQVVNGLMGMGLGPFLPGIVSDLLQPRFGGASLRYSLMLFSLLWIWAALHLLLATRTLRRDVERADAANLSTGIVPDC